MIGLDTNVLARYYIDDAADAEAQRQRLAARRLIESGQPLMVSKSVVLELEWIMRGYYGFAQAEVASVLRTCLSRHTSMSKTVMPSSKRSPIAKPASISPTRCAMRATDLATASQHLMTAKFARQAKKLGLAPAVMVVSQRSA